MNTLIARIAVIALAIGAVAVGSTGAFFSDSETSTGNTFTAGAIDLKIDNESYYNGQPWENTSWGEDDLDGVTLHKFFDFLDLKPSDYGEDTVSVHVDNNDAYLCADITLTSNDDNGINEPEGDDGDVTDGVGNGELADNVHFLWWADDGDNVLEQEETIISTGPLGELTLGEPYPFALADSDENIWGGTGPVTGDEVYYIGKAWCFGDISSAALPSDDYDSPADNNNGNSIAGEPEDGGIHCDGSLLNNSTQTDSLTADITFEAVQARHNDGFQCEEPPVIEACASPELGYADNVVTSDQGVRKNGTAVLAARTNPLAALGAPQSSGNAYDNPVPADATFFSLGFKNNGATPGGSIVVEFTDNLIVDEPGNDLKVWEVTGGTNYPDEHVKIEASQDGSTWYTVAADLTRDAQADLAGSGLAWAKYIRLTDISPIGPFEATADGYDLDAFQALHCGVRVNQ